nr:glycosyl transferase family 1 [Pseudomonadota bacterium]
PRARVFAALGAHAMLERNPSHDLSLVMMRAAGACLMSSYEASRREGWEWFEPDLSYDNARLCEGLLKAGKALDDRRMIDVGLVTLEWLTTVQTGPRGSFRPVGSNGFGRPYKMPLAYDQQPLEAAATVDAAAIAFTIIGDEGWERVARDAFGWYFGDNDGGIPLADVATGGCFDGLMATGINRNQGAESILALHLAAATMADVFGSERTGQDQRGNAKAPVPTP